MIELNSDNFHRLTAFACLIAIGTFVTDAKSELLSNYVFQGRGNWSLDGAVVGKNVQIDVPTGSTVAKAFLYASTALGTESPLGVTPEIQLGSETYGPSSFQPLPFIAFPGKSTGLQAFRADVTSQISTLVGSGSSVQFNLPISSATSTVGQVNGMLLAVIYSNPNERLRDIALLDGGSIGSQFTIDLHQPISLTTPGFEALLSLGIGFTANTFAQRTEVYVGDRLLTNGAGGADDGEAVSGAITVGGIGDNPANPDFPSAVDNFNVRDDEYYNLALGNAQDPTPFVASGQQHISFSTVNVGSDDNLFFVGLNVVVPEPSGMSLLTILIALGSMGTSVVARRKSRFQSSSGLV